MNYKILIETLKFYFPILTILGLLIFGVVVYNFYKKNKIKSKNKVNN